MSVHFHRLLAWVLLGLLTGTASAEVVRVQIDRREPFAGGVEFGNVGAYERLCGRIHFAVDPLATANARVVDLYLAPVNRDGRVEFWSDFCLLKPVDPTRGCQRLLYDVNNRGNQKALDFFNDRPGNDPRAVTDAGNGFLMRRGYSVLWCGWNGDVVPGDGRLLTGLPVATQNGEPILGRVHCEICVNELVDSAPLAWGNSNPYPPASTNRDDAVLSMQARRGDPSFVVPAGQWDWGRQSNPAGGPDPQRIFVRHGLQPGWLYDLVYTARDPRVSGLGFVAVRDLVSFLRHSPDSPQGTPNPLAGTVEKAIIFGVSQSGRFIHHFVWQGFNADLEGRIVFEGALPHVAGAGKGYFNHRFAQTTRHGSQHEDLLSPSEVFPFTTTPQVDPVTGERGDTLELARSQNCVPKMVFTMTSTEYWCRAASLLHTDVRGESDVPLDENVGLYFLCGAQHGNSRTSEQPFYQHSPNRLDHRPVLRSLLTVLDEWLTTGTAPPPSSYPTIAEGTLLTLADRQTQIPSRSGYPLPRAQYVPLRLDWGPRFVSDGIADLVPPRVIGEYVTRLPAVDEDGNEVGGVRLPAVAVPLGTYAGWNLRNSKAGAEGALARWAGSYDPFARTRKDRQTGDPRRSREERYSDQAEFIQARLEAARKLEAARFLLPEDVARVVDQAIADWNAPID